MYVTKILADLRAERELLENAIANLERLSHGEKRRRGRPPGSTTPPKQREAASAPITPEPRNEYGDEGEAASHGSVVHRIA
jgi:hypothetical protein